MLELRNVEVMYHPFILIVKGISLKVPDKSIVALLGPNGAGKTTTLKAISGIIKIDRGRVSRGKILLDGESIENQDPEKIAKKGVIYVAEGRRIFKELTVEENIAAVASAWPGCDPDIVYQYFPRLKVRRKVRAGYLSGGEQQMLAIGLALLAKPKLLLLDKPSLGLAPKVVAEVFKCIARLRDEEGVSILLVEQNARAALRIADYGYIMENGRIVTEGPSEELMKDKDIAEFYLGLAGRKARKSYQEVKAYRRKKRWI